LKNRLGFGSEALGDLHEASRILEPLDDAQAQSEVFRAIAVVLNWRGDGREAALALLRAVAEAGAARSQAAVSLALFDAARLLMEIGRAPDAHALLSRAFDIAGTSLPPFEFQRAWVNRLQAAVAAGLIEQAQDQSDGVADALAGAPPRLMLLAHLEAARLRRLEGDLAAARLMLDRAMGFASDAADSFERMELKHAEAELAIAEGRAETALELLDAVISRYANDDLAGREVKARLL
jgi:tetratricopeptide (TPR) repeat protein